MERLALVVLLACSCDPPPAPRAPTREPDTAWIRSPKLDPDLQELILRAYDEELAFPIRVERRDVGFEIVRTRPAAIEALVADDAVVSARCAPPPTESVPDEEWRNKVEPDVRMVHSANSACFVPVWIRFAEAATLDERAVLELMGGIVRTFDARAAVLYVPVRAIPKLAALPFVASVDSASRAYLEP